MAEPEQPGAGEERADHELAGTPRWVKVFALVALVVLVAFVILLVTGRGGDHGPGRHAAFGEADAVTIGGAAGSFTTGDRPRP